MTASESALNCFDENSEPCKFLKYYYHYYDCHYYCSYYYHYYYHYYKYCSIIIIIIVKRSMVPASPNFMGYFFAGAVPKGLTFGY